MKQNNEQGFLLGFVQNLTEIWVKRLSLVAVPPLRPRKVDVGGNQQICRDIFVIGILLFSMILIIFFHYYQGIRVELLAQLSATFGVYRAIDLLITIIRTGVFFSFRGDVQINEEPHWKIQRILLGVLLNYIELTMWYALIYFYLGKICPSQFNAEIKQIGQALHLSFTTMTTVGYGNYSPNRMLSILFSFTQAITGILLIAIVVGTLIALLTGSSRKSGETKFDEIVAGWFQPISCFLGMCTGIFFLLGKARCM